MHNADDWLSGAGEREWGGSANRYRISLRGDEMFCKDTVVMVTQLCQYVKNYLSVHPEGVNCIIFKN